MSLKDKVIIISGGTKGVGKALAIECVKQGANVVVGGRDKNSFDEMKSSLNTDNLFFVVTDLRNIKESKKIFEFAEEKFGRLDGLVNYAGVTPVASLADCDESTYDSVMDINLKAVFFNTQSAINLMKKNGGGSIILIGSSHAWRGEKNRAPYAISKGALLTLLEHIGFHYSKEHIRCNYVTMGWTPTDGELALREKEGINEETLKEMASKIIPMGRMTMPEDIVSGIMYLLSDESKMVTGSNIRISGGEYI